VVTDAETRAALATTRSLGAAGWTVHVTSAVPRSLAGASRYAASEHRLPAAIEQPGAWARELESLAGRLGADWVLPISEVSLGTIFAFDLDARLALIAPERESYARAIDKYALAERARALGLTVPPTRLVEDTAELSRLPAGFTYPAVLRARRSRFLREGRWIAGGIAILRGDDDRARAIQDPGFAAGALLQEYVRGHGEAVFALASEGRTLAHFAHRRLREKPPTGGVSVLRESVEPDAKRVAECERLLADLDWTGVAMIEFRRAPDGSAFLMEINPRPWGSLQLAIDAGVDFPGMLMRLARGETIAAVEPRIEVRSRWLLGDLDHLLSCLRRAELRAATGRGVGRVGLDFLRSFFDGSRLEVLRARDPRPFLRELRAWRP
jgi:predicted ATP-grasp superfamily ATP-dependent carboligase